MLLRKGWEKMYQTPNAGSVRTVGLCVMHPFVPRFLNMLVTYFVKGLRPRGLPLVGSRGLSLQWLPCGEAQPGASRLPWLQCVGSVAVCPGP